MQDSYGELINRLRSSIREIIYIGFTLYKSTSPNSIFLWPLTSYTESLDQITMQILRINIQEMINEFIHLVNLIQEASVQMSSICVFSFYYSWIGGED